MSLTRLLTYRAVNVLLLLIMAAGALGLLLHARLVRPQAPAYFASDQDHFLFGSVGSEAGEGIPYWVWLVLPRVFPEHLPRPGGYASIGFLAKDGYDMPVGFSRTTIGFPRVGLNCAACHTARYRVTADDVPTVVAGAPAHQAGAQEYVRFLFAAAADPRFTASAILAEIARNHELSFVDRLLYRLAIIPATRRALIAQAAEYRWMDEQPEWGRGRIDPVNPVKFRLLSQPADATIGAADMVPVWNLKAHAGYPLHWDGLNSDPVEAIRVSALASGATRDWIDADFRAWDASEPQKGSSLRRIHRFMTDLAPPTYPHAVDRDLAARGQTVFEAACASCHAAGGGRTGTIIPADEIGTDRHRLDAWTPAVADALNGFGEGHDWKFSHYRKTNGYVARPLDGIWLRAPYLHNGSVPTLADLLAPPDQRPARFWRGYDVLDTRDVGFIVSGSEAERAGTLFDTGKPGNSNSGHLYGTGLPADSKRSLIEYLKTL